MFTLDDYKGVIPAFITPFDRDGNYSEKSAAEMIEWLISKGIGGLYLTGSNGYGAAMDSDERMKVVESICRIVDGRIPVAAHIAAVSTKLSVRMAKHAESVGCVAVSAVPSYYYKLTPEQMYEYYEGIAKATVIPLIIYAQTHVYAPSVEMFEKLSEIEGVKGLKYTGADHYMMGRIKEHLGEEFKVYSGYDEMFLSGLLSGADALIGGTYNLYPDLYIRAIVEFFRGDMKLVQKDMFAANAILEILIKYDTQSAMRAGLSFMGIDAGFNPSPFGVLEGERREAFKNELKELKSKLDIEPIALFDAI